MMNTRKTQRDNVLLMKTKLTVLLKKKVSSLSPKVQQLRIHLPIQETQVRSLGLEDPLGEEIATHSSILA